MSADLSAALWTTVVTVALLVPGVVYAYVVLEGWIADDTSYKRVTASVERRRSRTGN